MSNWQQNYLMDKIFNRLAYKEMKLLKEIIIKLFMMNHKLIHKQHN